MSEELRIDHQGIVGKPVRLADGSMRIPARLSRVGVFTYARDDGSTVREYRPPNVVHHADTIASFRGVAVTELHPAEPVTASNWRDLSIGHVADNVHRSGDFLDGDVIVKDAAALAKVEAGELVEISCGYMARIDETPGTTPTGEKYDRIQTSIVGNHVALGPRKWGRMGSDVRLFVRDSAHSSGVAVAVSTVDERDQEMGAEAEKKETPETVPMALYTKACGERDAAVTRADAADKRIGEIEKAQPEMIRRAVDLRTKARSVDPEIKIDCDDATIMESVIKKARPSYVRDAAHDETYLRGRFDAIVEDAKSRSSSDREIEGFARDITERNDGSSRRDDGGDDDPIEASRATQSRFVSGKGGAR